LGCRGRGLAVRLRADAYRAARPGAGEAAPRPAGERRTGSGAPDALAPSRRPAGVARASGLDDRSAARFARATARAFRRGLGAAARWRQLGEVTGSVRYVQIGGMPATAAKTG